MLLCAGVLPAATEYGRREARAAAQRAVAAPGALRLGARGATRPVRVLVARGEPNARGRRSASEARSADAPSCALSRSTRSPLLSNATWHTRTRQTRIQGAPQEAQTRDSLLTPLTHIIHKRFHITQAQYS